MSLQRRDFPVEQLPEAGEFPLLAAELEQSERRYPVGQLKNSA